MIDKILNIKRLEYKSTFAIQDFKNELDAIFSQGVFNFKYNLSGKFINNYEFKVTDKWTIGLYIRSFENASAYLKGKITETSNGIILNVLVRPNSIFSIFGLLFPILGIFILFEIGFGITTEDVKIVGFMFILVGLFFLFIRYIS